ncbi:MAG TPA: hypothetical protein GX708_09775 [Gallicola sp.]|nr:hypothetical protein [Gallicola sp.]
MFSHSVLKRFVKDYSLPIQLIREPYFDYFIDLYNEQFNTKEKYKLLHNTIKQLGGENNFMEEYHKIKNRILDAVKNNPVFNEFNNSKLEEYNIPSHSYCKHDIFNCSNVEKYFISIDLKKANFQAMKHYNENLIFGFNTYEDFLNNFTDLEYMIKSKYIRQVIFGNLNPKKQIKIEQYLTYNLLQKLIKENIIKQEYIKMLSPDEIVCEFNIENYLLCNSYDLQLTKKIKKLTNLDVDIEIYKLKQIKPFKFFVKEFINKPGYQLMCVPIVYFAQIFKIYNNLEINDYDLSFFYENQVARFSQPLNKMEENCNEATTDKTKINE